MKKIVLLMGLIAAVFLLSVPAYAIVTQYPVNGYQTPAGMSVVATQNGIDLDHSAYYYWGLNDFTTVPAALNIVFHGVYDWIPETDQLAVYIKDGSTSLGWQTAGVDGESTSQTIWSGWNALGIWRDPTGGGAQRYDVVFTVDGAALGSFLANSGTFTIGIDPDCHYWGEKITVEAAAVPEPATLLLLGSGILGVVTFRRRFI